MVSGPVAPQQAVAALFLEVEWGDHQKPAGTANPVLTSRPTTELGTSHASGRPESGPSLRPGPVIVTCPQQTPGRDGRWNGIPSFGTHGKLSSERGREPPRWGRDRQVAATLCFSEFLLGRGGVIEPSRQGPFSLRLGRLWASVFSVMITALTVCQASHPSNSPVRQVVL